MSLTCFNSDKFNKHAFSSFVVIFNEKNLIFIYHFLGEVTRVRLSCLTFSVECLIYDLICGYCRWSLFRKVSLHFPDYKLIAALPRAMLKGIYL